MSETDTSSTPPRRAKLELLVRHDSDEGFDVREVGSATAFVQSRPQRVPAESWELAEMPSRMAGQPSYFLKNTTTDRFLLLTEPEKFLWEQMDGQNVDAGHRHRLRAALRRLRLRHHPRAHAQAAARAAADPHADLAAAQGAGPQPAAAAS